MMSGRQSQCPGKKSKVRKMNDYGAGNSRGHRGWVGGWGEAQGLV